MAVDWRQETWASIPPIIKDRIVTTYFCKKDSPTEYNKGYADALTQIFGINQLTSNIKRSPKYIKGDKVKARSGRVAAITDLYYDNKQDVWVYSMGNPAIYIPEPHLEPYLGNQDERPLKETGLIHTKQLYDALCQLESASVNVRKCLEPI